MRSIICLHAMKFSLRFCLLTALLSVVFFSCGRMQQDVSVSVADSLNVLSYRCHYRNLDSCRYYAERALALSHDDPTVMAQAYNTGVPCVHADGLRAVGFLAG